MEAEEPLGWWTISGSMIMRSLRRVQSGEDPEMVYAELYANSESHKYDADGKCVYDHDCEDN